MTDEEIERALDICAHLTSEHCMECPIEQEHKDNCCCGSVLAEHALCYIQSLKAEIAHDETHLNAWEKNFKKGEESVRKETAKEILKRVDEIESENHLDPKDSYDCNAIVAYNNIRKFIKRKYGVEMEE